MRRKKKFLTATSVIILCSLLISFALAKTANKQQQKFEPSWESLKNYPIAQWFADAKFGIFIHWGAYAVPAQFSEWYPRFMYDENHPAFKYHSEHFGDQSKFGYKDFIPLFKAEKFDADEWAELFKKAGARYVIPVAEHHDGFAMYDCSYTKYNAADMGPCRDIVGRLAEAVKNRGMIFGLSSHNAHRWYYYTYKDNYDTTDPNYAQIYCKPHTAGSEPSKEFLENWLARLKELVDKYEPSMMWFDFGWGRAAFEPYKKEFIAYYYNKAKDWNRDVVVTYKDNHLPAGVGALDIERGRLANIDKNPWQTDTSIDYRSWGYIQNPDYKSVNTLVDDLVDIVSKNGCLLLNIAPRSDGTIPKEQKERLLGIGNWLAVNGDAIYGTRPWRIYGEGPTTIKAGSFAESPGQILGASDIRFTTKENTLYAICLDWPGERLMIKSLSSISMLCPEGIFDVKMLGTNKKLKWKRDKKGLTIHTPKEKPCKHAYVFKITLEGKSEGRGFTNMKVVKERSSNKINVSATVVNYNKKKWSVKAGLYINGKQAKSVKVAVKPGATQKIAFSHQFDKAGIYKVAIGTADNLTRSETTLVPNIDLSGEWHFKEGDNAEWKRPEFDDGGWQKVNLPATWERHSSYTKDNAFGWYRRTITVPEEWKGHSLRLFLGKIDDVDETCFNGKRIGGMGQFPPNYVTEWTRLREYKVPSKLINYGKENIIAIRVFDGAGAGGLYEGPLGPVNIAD